jgi:hypothetical protein
MEISIFASDVVRSAGVEGTGLNATYLSFILHLQVKGKVKSTSMSFH